MVVAPSWNVLGSALPWASVLPLPTLDPVLQPNSPRPSAAARPILFRERNGWCPYSQRVWLALEYKQIPYETVLVDNTGGGKPTWFSGNTPQISWDDKDHQAESLDILRALDARFPDSAALWPPPGVDASEVAALCAAHKRIFPRGARPSSRAAFLFDWDGGPLPRAQFEDTLGKTDALLAERGGPFFAGEAFSAADCAWAPFLERYAAQLPLLHDGLSLLDEGRYPHLAAWLGAMQDMPAYSCRVKGDPTSWHKVLAVAGYGNAGRPLSPASARGRQLAAASPDVSVSQGVWGSYCDGRPAVAPTAELEAATVLLRNRRAIVADAARSMRRGQDEVEVALRALVARLGGIAEGDEAAEAPADVAAALAAHLDTRVCVPRDLGAPPAAALRALAHELGGKSD